MGTLENNTTSLYIISAFIIAFLLVIFIVFYTIEGSEWGLSQFFGVLVSAAASGLITFLLLFGQTKTTKQLHEMERRERVEREERNKDEEQKKEEREKIEKENQRERDRLERESFERREKNVKGYEQRIQAFSHFARMPGARILKRMGQKLMSKRFRKAFSEQCSFIWIPKRSNGLPPLSVIVAPKTPR